MKLRINVSVLIFLLLLSNINYCEAQINITETFKSELKYAQIILLGEPTHGEGNVFEYKTELIRYLHDTLRFDIIAFESGFYDVHHAQIQIEENPQVEAREYIRRAIFPIWVNSLEFQPFLKYFDKNKNDLKIAGFDNQLTGKYSRETLLKIIQEELPSNTTKDINFILLRNAFAHFEENYDFPPNILYKDLDIEISNLIKAVERSINFSNDKNWMLFALNNIRVLARDYSNKKDIEINESTWKASYSNTRDSMMAQNIIKLTKLYPNKKIICWGASTHFMGDPKETADTSLYDYKPAGLYLRKHFKEKLKSIAFISSDGEYGSFGNTKTLEIKDTSSIEHIIKQVQLDNKKDSSLVLKNTAWADQSFTSSCLENNALKAKWSAIFDILIYLPKYTTSNFVGLNNDQEITKKKNPSNTIEVTFLELANDKRVANVQFKITTNGKEYTSNMQGVIDFDKSLLSKTIELQSTEYETIVILLNNKNNTVYLKKKKYTLATVEVIAKRINVRKIIKKVEDNLSINYSTKEFKQQFLQKIFITNYDTVVFDIDGIVDAYPLTENTPIAKNMDYKAVRYNKMTQHKDIGKLKYSVYRFYNCSGIYLQPLFNLKKNLNRNYHFKLKKVKNDTNWGVIYVIDFNQKWMNNKLTDTWLFLKHTGTIYVRGKDWAIIKAEHTYLQDLDKLNKWNKKYGGKKSKVGNHLFWSNNEINSKIIHATENYFYDITTAKYYIKSSIRTEHTTGTFPNQEYDVTRKVAFSTLSSPDIINKQNCDFKKFNYYITNAEDDISFWKRTDILLKGID